MNLAGYRIGSITTRKGIIRSEFKQSFYRLFPRVIPWGQKEFQKEKSVMILSNCIVNIGSDILKLYLYKDEMNT